jgi:hypothetical protein
LKSLKDLFKQIFPPKGPDLEYNYKSGKSFEELQADLGAFKYSDDGFIFERGDFRQEIKWSEITKLNVYKVDLMTFDEVRMEIVSGDSYFEISEEIPGWYQFVKRTKSIFPSISQNWDAEIIHPAFATNYKTIYSAATD